MQNQNGVYPAHLPRRTHLSHLARDDFTLYKAMGIEIGPRVDDFTVSVRLPEGLRLRDGAQDGIVNLEDDRGGVRCKIVRPRGLSGEYQAKDYYVLQWNTRFSVTLEHAGYAPQCRERLSLCFNDRARKTRFGAFEVLSRYDGVSFVKPDREFFDAHADTYTAVQSFREELLEEARGLLARAFPRHNDPAAYWNDDVSGQVADVKAAFAALARRVASDEKRMRALVVDIPRRGL